MLIGLELQVAKQVYSTVYVTLDDADPKYADWFKDGKIVYSRAMTRTLTEAIKDSVYDIDDWDSSDRDADFTIRETKVVTAEKADDDSNGYAVQLSPEASD